MTVVDVKLWVASAVLVWGVSARPVSQLGARRKQVESKKRGLFWQRKNSVRGASNSKSKTSLRFPVLSLLPAVLVLLLLILSAGAYRGVDKMLSQSVTRVVVNGEFHHVDRQAIVDQVTPFLSESFVKADLAGIRLQLLRRPWVYKATVSRRWPEEIVIDVEEQKPIAKWGEGAYLNHRGEMFSPDKSHKLIRTDLPLLYGPQGSAEQVMNYFQELGNSFRQQGLSLQQLKLNERGGWVAVLAGDVTIVMGSGDVMEKMHRFSTAYQRSLESKFDRIKRIDLRYGNGLAVQWREPLGQG